MKINSIKLATIISIFILLQGCASLMNRQLGMNNDVFSPCPSSPNCVSSMDEETNHFVEPICYQNISTYDAKSALIELLNEEQQCEIIIDKKHYIHAECKSKFFNFIDDVEFYFPLNEKLIHVKSAARSGYYDFGKNRARINRIAEAFKTEINAASCIK